MSTARKISGLVQETCRPLFDLDNVVGAAISPELLGDQLLAFAERFGAIVAPTAEAISYIFLAVWDARAVEASFIVRHPIRDAASIYHVP